MNVKKERGIRWSVTLLGKENTGERKKMTYRYDELTADEIGHVREWVNQYEVGETFTFSGWKAFFRSRPGAPAATKIGRKVVEALEKEPVDSRLDFISLSEGLRKNGEIGDKKSNNAQYYRRNK